MSNYLRPRRGKAATAGTQLASTAPLKNGEIFFESESIGAGRGNIMMGDGSTAYNSLTYFLVNEDKAMSYSSCSSINGSTSTADSTLLGSITNSNTSGTFKNAMNAIKQILWNHSTQIANKVSKSGDTMTGDLYIGASKAATESYVTSQVGAVLNTDF